RLPGAFLPFPDVYSPSLAPLPPADDTPLGWLRALPVRCASNAATAAARSSGRASAHRDRDNAPPAAGSHRTESPPARASDSANRAPMATGPSLPAPHARLSTPQSPPAAPVPSFPGLRLAAPAGRACPARAADARSPRARFLGFLPSPWEDDPISARTLPDPATCFPRSPATIHGAPPI